MGHEITTKGPIAVVLAFISYLTGIFSDLLVALLTIQMLDYATGIMRAIATRSLNSTVGLQGIMKKITMLIIVGMSACLEYVLVILHMPTHNAVVVTVICFFIVNEAISVLENSAQLGVPIPKFIYETLEKLEIIAGKEQKVSRPKRKRS